MIYPAVDFKTWYMKGPDMLKEDKIIETFMFYFRWSAYVPIRNSGKYVLLQREYKLDDAEVNMKELFSQQDQFHREAKQCSEKYILGNGTYEDYKGVQVKIEYSLEEVWSLIHKKP